MKLSTALDLVWRLAAQEAVNAAFAAIEPEHLLEAVLKFAELRPAEFAQAGIDAALAQLLADEVSQVQAELARRQIDSRTARRRLRARLGRGDQPAAAGPVAIHRSPASRARFAAASELARQQSQAVTGAAHLLTALLASPTPVMVEVLGAALGPEPARPLTPSQLIAPGRDLVPLAASGRLPANPNRQPECTALLHLWNQPRARCVLLVGAEEATAATVAALAHVLAARPAEALPALRRLVDLSTWPAEQPDQFPELLPELLGKAAGKDDLILVLPTLRDEPDSAAQAAYRAVLAHALRTKPPRCLCPVEPAAYRRWLEKDLSWQRLTQAMWLRPAAAAGLPSQL